ncbi:hypothetical protein, partial [Endozoicomonas sp. ONNA2]|uniref:hypothetical protein n=1 Tax=Endozoicomonas sp. ONNA2 TaxID=2828741 RepID=UPI0021498C3C
MLQSADGSPSLLTSSSSVNSSINGKPDTASSGEALPLSPVLTGWGRMVDHQGDKSLPGILPPACDETIEASALQRGVES